MDLWDFITAECRNPGGHAATQAILDNPSRLFHPDFVKNTSPPAAPPVSGGAGGLLQTLGDSVRAVGQKFGIGGGDDEDEEAVREGAIGNQSGQAPHFGGQPRRSSESAADIADAAEVSAGSSVSGSAFSFGPGGPSVAIADVGSQAGDQDQVPEHGPDRPVRRGSPLPRPGGARYPIDSPLSPMIVDEDGMAGQNQKARTLLPKSGESPPAGGSSRLRLPFSEMSTGSEVDEFRGYPEDQFDDEDQDFSGLDENNPPILSLPGASTRAAAAAKASASRGRSPPQNPFRVANQLPPIQQQDPDKSIPKKRGRSASIPKNSKSDIVPKSIKSWASGMLQRGTTRAVTRIEGNSCWSYFVVVGGGGEEPAEFRCLREAAEKDLSVPTVGGCEVFYEKSFSTFGNYSPCIHVYDSCQIFSSHAETKFIWYVVGVSWCYPSTYCSFGRYAYMRSPVEIKVH